MPVLQLMERVADWQLANPAKYPETDWTVAAGYTGIMALSRISARPEYLQAMLAMAERNRWALGPNRYHADDHCVGQTYVELYQHYGDPKMYAGLKAGFDWILANPKDRSLGLLAPRQAGWTDRWAWCDALFMAPPAWLQLHRITGEPAYLNFMLEEWRATTDCLYDRAERLYARDRAHQQKLETNGRKVFWSRGNGWVLAGLARVLELLPEDHPQRRPLLAQYAEMCDRILSSQQPDGFWRASLLHPEAYPMREVSGTGFFCYALGWGLNRGILVGSSYAAAVKTAWAALASCVTPEGRLTHVQPIGETPSTFDSMHTEPFGVGAFLLAGAEVYRAGARL